MERPSPKRSGLEKSGMYQKAWQARSGKDWFVAEQLGLLWNAPERRGRHGWDEWGAVGLGEPSSGLDCPSSVWFGIDTMKNEIHPACRLCAGSCCRYIILPGFFRTSEMSSDSKQWLSYHGEREGNDMILSLPCKWLVNGQCGIYERRPQVCREFKPGSRLCRHAVLHCRAEQAEQILKLCQE